MKRWRSQPSWSEGDRPSTTRLSPLGDEAVLLGLGHRRAWRETRPIGCDEGNEDLPGGGPYRAQGAGADRWPVRAARDVHHAAKRCRTIQLEIGEICGVRRPESRSIDACSSGSVISGSRQGLSSVAPMTALPARLVSVCPVPTSGCAAGQCQKQAEAVEALPLLLVSASWTGSATSKTVRRLLVGCRPPALQSYLDQCSAIVERPASLATRALEPRPKSIVVAGGQVFRRATPCSTDTYARAGLIGR